MADEQLAIRPKPWLLLGLFAAVLAALVSFIYSGYKEITAAAAPEDRAVTLQTQARIPAGVLVKSVPLLTQARRVGLAAGDIITKYNGDPVFDLTSYYQAIDAHQQRESVNLTVARQGSLIQLVAPPGLLGFTAADWTLRRDEILDLVRNKNYDEAHAAIENAGSTKTLSDYDLLVLRIASIPDDDTSQDTYRQQLLDELLSKTPDTHLPYLSTAIFYHHNAMKAAVAVYQRRMIVDPDDGAFTSMGLAYLRLRRFEDAEQIATDALLNHAGLSDEQRAAALKIKAFVREARGEYGEAAGYFRHSLQVAPDDDDMNVRTRYLLSLAKLGNLSDFEEAAKFCDAHPGTLFAQRPYYVDALRGYLLLRNGQRDKAAAVIEKWKSDPDARRRVVEYWSVLPVSKDVVTVWNQFLP